MLVQVAICQNSSQVLPGAKPQRLALTSQAGAGCHTEPLLNRLAIRGAVHEVESRLQPGMSGGSGGNQEAFELKIKQAVDEEAGWRKEPGNCLCWNLHGA